MNNGVSKKLCITAASILAIVQLAEGANDKWPYAIVSEGIMQEFSLIEAVLNCQFDALLPGDYQLFHTHQEKFGAVSFRPLRMYDYPNEKALYIVLPEP